MDQVLSCQSQDPGCSHKSLMTNMSTVLRYDISLLASEV